MRYAKVKHGRICSISSELYENDENYQVIKIPDELSDISSKDLILNSRTKNGEIFYRFLKKPASQIKVAVISNWKSQCGLSTYMENLFPEIAKQVGHFKIFIEKNEYPTANVFEVGGQIVPHDQVVSCWKRGEPLQDLVNYIKEYNPDIILINHEWGIFPDPKHWLSFLTQLSDYRIITIMHSIFPYHLDKTIVEASMTEIVVHLEGAKQSLIKDKNINAKIHVIPHGCYPLDDTPQLWNIYKSEHNFLQIGFGLRYKAFEESIIAVSLLKEKYPDIFFTAIFSEAPNSKYEHEIYYQELVKLIDQLNVKESVGIIRGFQSDTCLNAYFRTNKAAVFPYKSSGIHFVYGASGASRMAMSKQIPVITSSIPHFSDLPTIKADTPEDIAKELDKLFLNKKLVLEQLDKQNQFIIENSWENIAKQYVAVFEN